MAGQIIEVEDKCLPLPPEQTFSFPDYSVLPSLVSSSDHLFPSRRHPQ